MSKERINTDIFIHHSQLFWNVTSIFTAVVGGLLIFLWGQENNNIILNGFGLFLTGVIVYFASSFRVLKQNAFAKAILNDEQEPYKQHLNQWIPYLIVWWILGVLYVYDGYTSIKPTKECTIALIIIWMIWSGYVGFMGVKYNKSKEFRRALKKFCTKRYSRN